MVCGGSSLVQPRLMKILGRWAFGLDSIDSLLAWVLATIRGLFGATLAKAVTGYRLFHGTSLSTLFRGVAIGFRLRLLPLRLASFAAHRAALRMVGRRVTGSMILGRPLSGWLPGRLAGKAQPER